jgi:hypothetical protein
MGSLGRDRKTPVAARPYVNRTEARYRGAARQPAWVESGAKDGRKDRTTGAKSRNAFPILRRRTREKKR